MTSQNHVAFRQILENSNNKNNNKAISKTALKHAVKNRRSKREKKNLKPNLTYLSLSKPSTFSFEGI